MSIYKSHLPNIDVPKHSVFEHIFPTTNDPFPESSTALVDAITGKVTTRGQLKRAALTLAYGVRNSLTALGGTNLKRGDTALVFSPNSVLYPIVSLGLVAAGVRATFSNTAYTPPELAHQLTNSRASHVFVAPALLPVLLATFERLNVSATDAKKRVVVVGARSEVPLEQYGTGWVTLEELLEGEKQLAPEKFEGKDAHETAYLFYSSGTTGLSKGVETTHNGVNTVLEMCKAGWKHFFPERDVLLAVLPFFHVFGGVVVSLAPLSIGVPLVVLPRFQPPTFLAAIQKYKVTGAYLAPPILLFMGKHPMIDDYDVSSLRNILLGAAPVSSDLILSTRERFRKRGAVHLEITQAFGLTETTATTHILPPEHSIEKIGSIGVLLPNQEARLVDDEDVDVKAGERGELWIRGDNIMKGYLFNEKATKDSVTSDGWFKTGDIAVRDADGFYKIVDRKKELIKYKGWQVPPAELEALLISHPEVADAGVIGIMSDEEATELPRGYIVPRDTTIKPGTKAAEAFALKIGNWIQTKVAQHKFLRGGVIVRDNIPQSAAGKILRKDLREIAKKEVAAAAAGVKAKL